MGHGIAPYSPVTPRVTTLVTSNLLLESWTNIQKIWKTRQKKQTKNKKNKKNKRKKTEKNIAYRKMLD
jgi:hypothetical protein